MSRQIRKATPSFEVGPMLMALVVALAFLTYAACDTSPAPVKPKAHVMSPAAYSEAVTELTALSREASGLFAAGKGDAAGALVQKGEILATKVLGIPRPTLAATEAASDIDHLYGRMLAANHNYGWARLQFQKNLVRWKYWKPETSETQRRFREAQTAIADMDKHMK